MRLLQTIKQWGFKEKRVAAFIISLIAVVILFSCRGSGYVSFVHQNVLQIELNTETKVYLGNSGGFICDTVHHSCIDLDDEQCSFLRSCVATTFIFTRTGVYTIEIEQKSEDLYKFEVTSYCMANEERTRKKWST